MRPSRKLNTVGDVLEDGGEGEMIFDLEEKETMEAQKVLRH